MKTEAKCTFKIASWDEATYKALADGAKLTKASVTQNYSGELSGESLVEFLMSYTAQGTVAFVGLEWITGCLAGKTGSFIIQHIGTFDSDGAHSQCTILPASGTGELAGICGSSSYTAVSEAVEMLFSYEIVNQSN